MVDDKENYGERMREGMREVKKIRPENNNYGDALYRLKPKQMGHVIFTIDPREKGGASYHLHAYVTATKDGYHVTLDTETGDGNIVRDETTGSLELSLGREGFDDCVVRRNKDPATDSKLKHTLVEEAKPHG